MPLEQALAENTAALQALTAALLKSGTTTPAEKPAKKPAAKKDDAGAPATGATATAPAEKPAAGAPVVALKTYTDAFLKLMNDHGRAAGTDILKEYGVERASMVKEEKRNEAYAKVQAAQKAGDEAKAKAAAEAKASEDDSLI